MGSLKSYSCEPETVIYNVESGDMHLLSASNAELLGLINQKVEIPHLLQKIIDTFQLSGSEAEEYLFNLKSEYRKLNLIN